MNLLDFEAALAALTDEERHRFLDEGTGGPAICERLLVVLARRVGADDVECWQRGFIGWCVKWREPIGWTRYHTDPSRIRAVTAALEATKP